MPPQPILLDATGLAKRCIMACALDDLSAGGTFTGGLFASLKSLRGIMGLPDIRPGPVYAFFDCGTPSIRTDLLPGYKQKRKERRDRLSPEDKERAYTQVAAFERILPLLGVRTFKYRNREADDGVAAAARICASQGLDPVIVTGDKDLFQLIAIPDADVSVYYLKDKRLITQTSFRDEVGVEPETFLLYKLMVGDTSDEVPGIHGVGKGRAAQVVNEVADEIMETPPGGCLLGDAPVEDQLDNVVAVLKQRKKLRKFEQAIIDQAEDVKRILPVINLSDSWGDDAPLRRKMAEPAKLQTIEFIRACRKYKFSSIISDIKTFTRPFEAALS